MCAHVRAVQPYGGQIRIGLIWVPQDPRAWARPKLVFRDIAAEPAFWLELDPAVGNGDCYWLTARQPTDTELLWLAAAVGNSTFIQ